MQDPIVIKIESTPRPTLFAASGFVLLAAVGLWVSALTELLPGAGMVAVNLLYYLPFMALPVALYLKRRPAVSASLRLNPLPPLAALAAILLALLSVYVASVLSAVWGDVLSLLGLRSPGAIAPPATRSALAADILLLAALPAVCEELLFRGFALAAWESRGTRFAVAVTAALFALLHGNLHGLPAYLLVGGVAGFLAYAVDSVYAAMVYHTVYNALCLVISYLAAGSEAAQAAPDMAGILSLALQAAMFAALMAALLATLGLRARLQGRIPNPRIRRPLQRRDRLMLLAALLVMTGCLVALALMAARGGAA